MTILDITYPISTSIAVWQGDPPVVMEQVSHIKRGDVATVTRINLSAHTGTHLDAPAHFIEDGGTVENLDLDILVGPVTVYDLTQVEQINAAALATLNIPSETKRVLFKTRNTTRKLLEDPAFHEDYVAIEEDAAEWLVAHGIHLVGVDYLSVAPFHDLVSTHRILLAAGVIAVEGLVLQHVEAGDYELVCLPIKLQGSDGAPARAILIA